MTPSFKTPQAMYDELVAAIVKAVPWSLSNKDGLYFVKRIYSDDQAVTEPCRSITLDDVLRAIKQKYKDARIEWESSDDNGLRGFYVYSGTDSSLFAFLYFGRTLSWLHEHDPQAIASLHSLLYP